MIQTILTKPKLRLALRLHVTNWELLSVLFQYVKDDLKKGFNLNILAATRHSDEAPSLSVRSRPCISFYST